MIIANPMYDTIFKYLMEDNVVAKGLISRILQENIIELIPTPQEETTSRINLKYSNLGIRHQDYVAIIKNKNGGLHKIAVEVQKSYIAPKIATFRTYIAEKYKKPSTIDNKEVYLPIKTIYFIEETFNDKLPPVLKVNREYIDVLNQKKYEGEKDEFVSQMTHEAYFIQTELIPPSLENDISRVLNFFSNKFHIEVPKGKQLSPSQKRKIARELNIPDEITNKISDKLFSRIITRLFGADNNPNVQLNVELGQKYQDQEEARQEEMRIKLEQNEQEIKQNKQVIEQKDQALEQKDQELQNQADLIKKLQQQLDKNNNL